MADRDPVSLPAEVRAKLAELELELSEGEYLNFTAELARSLARSAPAPWLPVAGVKGSTLAEFGVQVGHTCKGWTRGSNFLLVSPRKRLNAFGH